MLTYRDLIVGDSCIQEIRRSLYHSQGEGYFVFREFLDAEFAAHLQTFWTHPDTPGLFSRHIGTEHFHSGCPNSAIDADSNGNSIFYNFFWNSPVDEATYDISLHIQLLRARVEGRPSYHEIFPFQGQSTSFSVRLTRNGVSTVPPHRDYVDAPGDVFDPKRLQATLILAEKGVDYGGTGFVMENNQGQQVVWGDDLPLKPGDLVLWRYNNLHSMPDVSSSDDQLGFLRILYPPMYIRPRLPFREIGGKLKVHVKQNPLVARYGVPLYRKMTGRA